MHVRIKVLNLSSDPSTAGARKVCRDSCGLSFTLWRGKTRVRGAGLIVKSESLELREVDIFSSAG